MAFTKKRVFVGELSSRLTEDDIRREFGKFGSLTRVDMKQGFAFVEYGDEKDAEDAVKDMHDRDMEGRRIRVEFSRPRPERRDFDKYGDRRDDRRGGYDDRRGGGYGYDDRRGGYDDRRGSRYDDRRGGYDDRRGGYDDRRGGYDDRRGGGGSRGQRTQFRVIVTNLSPSTSWQDLKDFGRTAGQVLYTAVRDEGSAKIGVIEYTQADDMREAVKRLDGDKLHGSAVRVEEETPANSYNSRGGSNGGGRGYDRRSRSRSRSPRDREGGHRDEHPDFHRPEGTGDADVNEQKVPEGGPIQDA